MAWASVRPSHPGTVSKRRLLESRNFYCGLPQCLWFFVTKFCAPGCGGSPRTRASKRGTPLKRCYFAVIGAYSVKMVADRYRHAAYHNKHWWQALLDLSTSMTLNDLELPQNGVLVNFSQFWMQHTFQHWIATKWPEIDQENQQMKFSALNIDFSVLSSDLLGSRRPAQVNVRDGYPLLKSGYFTAVILCSVNTVADRHRHAAYHDKQ